MRSLVAVFGMLALVAITASAEVKGDTCALISTTKMESLQEAKFVTAVASQHDDGKLTSASCYYRMAPEASSVSLEVLSKSKGDSLNPREFWKSRFEKQPDNDEAKEKPKTPQKISGVGDEAYWVDTGRDGALYVLAGSRIFRLSLGGKSSQVDKRNRAIELLRSRNMANEGY